MMLKFSVGILLPFIATSLGSAAVFLIKNNNLKNHNSILSGFSAGIMFAASIWGLIIPCIEKSENFGKLAFLPVSLGIIAGIGYLLISDYIFKKTNSKTDKNYLINLAIILHNLPEGIAVGIAFSGAFASEIPFSQALALSLGISIQNIPEGAIISLPAYSNGKSKTKAFLSGVVSGIIEPVGAIATLFISLNELNWLPFILSFAAGAMIYVCINDLIPDAKQTEKKNSCIISFTVGFLTMMILDISL